MHVHFYYKKWLKLGYSIFFLDKTCTSLALCHTQIQFCIFFGIFYSTQPPNSSCFDSDVDLTLQKIRGLCLLKLGISRKASKICQIFRIRKLKYIHLFLPFSFQATLNLSKLMPQCRWQRTHRPRRKLFSYSKNMINL